MNRELDFFREFVRQYVPKGELITDSHIAAAAWHGYFNDHDIDMSSVDENFDPDILTPEDFIDKSFFPDL